MRPVAIGIGANLGDRAAAIDAAAAALVEEGRVARPRLSSLYETSPIGPEQPEFLNAVLVGESAASPRELLRAALRIESRLGRRRDGERWGPRAIDIDLLAVGDLRVDETDLALPHPRIAERRFVLDPWAEVDPDFIVPGLDSSVAALLAALLARGDSARVERRAPAPRCGTDARPGGARRR